MLLGRPPCKNTPYVVTRKKKTVGERGGKTKREEMNVFWGRMSEGTLRAAAKWGLGWWWGRGGGGGGSSVVIVVVVVIVDAVWMVMEVVTDGESECLSTIYLYYKCARAHVCVCVCV